MAKVHKLVNIFGGKKCTCGNFEIYGKFIKNLWEEHKQNETGK